MSTTDNTNAALRGSESNDQLGPLPEPALTHDRHGHRLLIGPCYTSNQMRAYAAQERAAERERCARLCDEQERQWLEAARLCGGDDGNEVCRANMAAELATEIRA